MQKTNSQIEPDIDYEYNKLLQTKIDSLSEHFESILSNAVNNNGAQSEQVEEKVEEVKEVKKKSQGQRCIRTMTMSKVG